MSSFFHAKRSITITAYYTAAVITHPGNSIVHDFPRKDKLDAASAGRLDYALNILTWLLPVMLTALMAEIAAFIFK